MEEMTRLTPNKDIGDYEIGFTTIKIDGQTYTLILDLNAIDTYETATGQPVLSGKFRPSSITETRELLYACLLPAQPTITKEWVGDKFSLVDMRRAFDAVGELIGGGDAVPKELLAPFVPTSPDVLELAFKTAGFNKGMLFVDLGAGDGRAVLKALMLGAGHAYGFELSPDRCAQIKRNLVNLKQDANATIKEGDFRETSIEALRNADVVFMYLLQGTNDKLRAMLLKNIKPGAVVVSHDFSFKKWVPNQTAVITSGEREHTIRTYVFPPTQEAKPAPEVETPAE